MKEREIHPGEWSQFSSRFTDQHHGWLTRAERRGTDGRVHTLWTDAALESLLVVHPDAGHGGAVIVSVITPDARTGPGAHLALQADHPRRLFVLETEDGRDAGLRVVDTDGGVTELRFRVNARPSTVNGVIS